MISAILLAAGLSRRMGRTNKLLMPINGVPMAVKVLTTLQAAAADELIVVTGYQADRLLAALDRPALNSVYNPNYKDGMTSSIQTGIAACSPETGGYMICLADMPYITAGEYRIITESFRNDRLKPFILLPKFESRQGHPVVFSSHHREALLNHSAPNGCRGLVEQYPERCHYIDMPTANILRDIDSPEAFP